jgi:hypothetical protein
MLCASGKVQSIKSMIFRTSVSVMETEVFDMCAGHGTILTGESPAMGNLPSM